MQDDKWRAHRDTLAAMSHDQLMFVLAYISADVSAEILADAIVDVRLHFAPQDNSERAR